MKEVHFFDTPKMGIFFMDYLGETLKIATKGIGRVSPNPLVGAVIVKNGKIIASGFHKKFGGAHAEINALQKAGAATRGADLYVNLEPCVHFGKTPPCVDVIIRAGVKRVYVGMLDPNPLVAGRGAAKLRRAGIKVFLLNDERAKKLNEIFVKFITTGRPFVVAKWAMSLDGKIATEQGDSKWISGEKSRAVVHALRAGYDAILVGVNTIVKDNPRLSARLPKSTFYPIRIILDSRGATPLAAKIFSEPGENIIATTEKMPAAKAAAYVKRGATIIKTKSREGKVNLKELLKKLAERNIAGIFVEGGGETLASFFRQNLIDKSHIFIAPKIIGGATALTPVAGVGVKTVADSSRWRFDNVEQTGEDIFITAYPV